MHIFKFRLLLPEICAKKSTTDLIEIPYGMDIFSGRPTHSGDI